MNKVKGRADWEHCLKSLRAVSQSPETEACIILEELEHSELELQDIIDLRLQGKPLQYILKSWQFRYLDLYIDERVLIPRPETEITTQQALDCLNQISHQPLSVLDLGCGSGAIGLSILKEALVPLNLVLADISAEALEVAAINFERNFNKNTTNKNTTNTAFRVSNYFKSLDTQLFHLIVSNPPYVGIEEELPAEVKDYEPAIALRSGETGFEDIKHIIENARDWLHTDGWLVLELAPHQAEAAKNLAEEFDYSSAFIHLDLAGRQRILTAQR